MGSIFKNRKDIYNYYKNKNLTVKEKEEMLLNFIFKNEIPVRLKKEIIKFHSKSIKTISQEGINIFKMTGDDLPVEIIQELKIKFKLTNTDFGKI